MKNIVQQLREAQNLTQTELAEKTGLSLRTIQRIEAGNVPRGFTLKTLAKTLEIAPEKLTVAQEPLKTDRAKLINLSALMGLVFPFGGVIFPLILTYKTRDEKNRALGKSIVSVQIVLWGLLSCLLIACPFAQKFLALQYPLFLVVLLGFILAKLWIVILNGISLNQNGDLHKYFKWNYL